MAKYSNPPNQSKGILDDFAVRKNVATREGTIEKVPINDNDIANKKYVDDNAGGATSKSSKTADYTITTSDFGKIIELGVGSSKWDDFTKPIKLRNRITHPKQTTDILISDDELQLAVDVNAWFNQIINEVIGHVSVYYNGKA